MQATTTILLVRVWTEAYCVFL